MTTDQAVALSLLPDLSRLGLSARLFARDPTLLDAATLLLPHAREVRQKAEAAGIGVVSWNDPHFPAWLLTIPDCPPALWYRGSLECLRKPLVAIVGSRSASRVSLETAARLAEDLASLGVTVVSGLARGVDSAAHRGALRAGRTVAVLGSGVDRVYPAEHQALALEIVQKGVVLSEYPPGTPPLAFHFPMRNRLISGLSRATIVVEAAEKSGSLITAACALEQGREVMAVPGSVLGGRNKGGHALIRDGARLVEDVGDIVQELADLVEPAQSRDEGTTDAVSTVSGDPIVGKMDVGEAYDLDAIGAASGLDAAALLARLTELELRGFVVRGAGGRYIRQS